MKRKPTARVGLTAAVLLLGSRSVSAAASPRTFFDLAWSAPAGCPDEAHVRDTIERLAGPSDAAAETPLAARAVATHGADGLWRLHLTTDRSGSHGERDITGESCEALAGSAAVILALVLNPAADLTALNGSDLDATSSSQPKSAADRPNEVSLGTAQKVTPTADAPHDVPISRRSSHWLIGASGAFDIGALPESAWGVTGIIGGRVGRARIEVPLTWWFPRHRLAPSDGTKGGDFSLVSGGAMGCYDWAASRIAAGPCVGFELGAMRAKAFGVRAPGDVTELWVAALLGGSALLEVTPTLGIHLGVFAGIPLRRPDFVLEGVGSVHQPDRIVGRAALGARIQF